MCYRGLCPRTPEVYRIRFQEGGYYDCMRKATHSAALPQTRCSAQVAPQRCLILCIGKAYVP